MPMKISICAIGKHHEAYVRDGIEEFTKRISRYFPIEWNILPTPKNSGTLSEMDLKTKECESILNWMQEDDFLVALDENGKHIKSEGLAQFIQKHSIERTKNLVFVIGGAYGLDKIILTKSKYQLSLSQFTFPHQLVRLILIEQIYRACTILRNEKYHHK